MARPTYRELILERFTERRKAHVRDLYTYVERRKRASSKATDMKREVRAALAHTRKAGLVKSLGDGWRALP